MLASAVSCGLLTVAIVTLSSTAQAQLEVPGIFADNMILQRQMPLQFWGKGDNGTSVEVEFNGIHQSAPVSNGRWQIELPAQQAGGPHTLKISDSKTSLNFSDIYVGEVILLAGQSNARWPIIRTPDASARVAMARANSTTIRQFNHAYQATSQPAFNVRRGEWINADAQKIGLFSLLGYYYALALQEQWPDMPIGIVESAVGGTFIDSWLPSEVLTDCEPARAIAEAYTAAIPAEEARHVKALAEYETRAAASGRPAPQKPSSLTQGPRNNNHPSRPGAYYNGRIAPLVGLPVRAVIWYQGESDGYKTRSAERMATYSDVLEAMITQWRTSWGRTDLPFFIVQLPSFESADYNYIPIRNAQTETARKLEQAGLIITLDTGDATDIHPADKGLVAERLAKMTFALQAQQQDWETQGAQLQQIRREGSAVLLDFSGTAPLRNAIAGLDPLLAMSRGSSQQQLPLSGFELRGSDGISHPAQATLSGNHQVKVWSDKVEQPVWIGYLQKNNAMAEVSLYDANGFPAAPISADIP